MYILLADFVLVVHLLFILFVLFGCLIALWAPRSIWFHLPAVGWGILIEVFGWTCPLTPLENLLRTLGGRYGYEESFVEHYLLPVIYPGYLTREIQFVFAGIVLLLNLSLYCLIYKK